MSLITNFLLLCLATELVIAWTLIVVLVIHAVPSWLLMLRQGYGLVGVAVMMNLSWWLRAYTRASSFVAVRKPPSLPITFCPCALLPKVPRSVTLKITLVIEVSSPGHPASELLSSATTLIMAPAGSSSHLGLRRLFQVDAEQWLGFIHRGCSCAGCMKENDGAV